MLLVEAVDILTMLSGKEASAKLPELIDDVTVSHEPLVITGKHRNAVLVAEDQWKAITENLHLFSSPGMRKINFRRRAKRKNRISCRTLGKARG